MGTALFGTVLAVLALCATAIFGASLSHLTATPKLYGDPFQLSFNPNGGPSNPALLSSLEHDKAVTGITEWPGGATISVNEVQVGIVAASATRGRLLFSTAEGHLPSGVDQIGLGAATMRKLGAHVGSVVRLSGSPGGKGRTQPMRVVAQVSFPVIAGGVVSLGTGALITTAGLEHAVCPPGPHEVQCRQMLEQQSNGGILVSVESGPRGRVAIDHYLSTYSSIATLPATPTSLINFGEAVDFPLIFGAILAIFGAATLAHLLVVSVSRRRREIGLLKVLGFVNSQVVSAVAWQATTVALVGIVVGVPLGVVAGRAIWDTFSDNLGAVPVAVVPILGLLGLVGGVLVAANLIALAPALMARRAKPSDLMRAP